MDTVVLDGALGTELESRGHCINTTCLWSSALLQTPQGRAAIERVHLDYFCAGAQVATTATYQLARPTCEQAGVDSEADMLRLFHTALELAHSARAQFRAMHPESRRPLFVAGSCGSFGATLCNGAEFTGIYPATASTVEQLVAFHRFRVAALRSSASLQPDLLAFETVPKLEEVRAIATLLRTEFPESKAWISVTCRDEATLSDGQSLRSALECVESSPQIIAFGVNCVSPPLASRVVRNLHTWSPAMPLVCYPNSGEVWDGEKRSWEETATTADSAACLASCARDWVASGVRFVGGCCRTRPQHISLLRDALL